MANAEDLNRLTVCALVLLGHIFLSLGNSRESMNMVTPAMQLSSKIPDTHVQLWASAILKGKENRLSFPFICLEVTSQERSTTLAYQSVRSLGGKTKIHIFLLDLDNKPPLFF